MRRVNSDRGQGLGVGNGDEASSTGDKGPHNVG